MAAKKEPGGAWRHTTVLVRADIFAQAREKGIDISDTCNRALADLLGVDYHQQQIDSVPVPPPVIIAKNGGVPSGGTLVPHTAPQPPVINADDPKAAGTIASVRKQPVKRTATPPPEPDAPAQQAKPVKASQDMPSPPRAAKTERAVPKKTEKSDAIKKFVAAMILREDAENAVIGKEELYQFFSRWCREQKFTPVPDAKTVAVTLKTRFAIREKNSGGRPCWAGVRLKK
jgi:hypothetical protein